MVKNRKNKLFVFKKAPEIWGHQRSICDDLKTKLKKSLKDRNTQVQYPADHYGFTTNHVAENRSLIATKMIHVVSTSSSRPLRRCQTVSPAAALPCVRHTWMHGGDFCGLPSALRSPYFWFHRWQKIIASLPGTGLPSRCLSAPDPLQMWLAEELGYYHKVAVS